MATRDGRSYNEETFKIVVLGKEALIYKEEKTSKQVEAETYAKRETQMKLRYSDIALFYRSISMVSESKAFRLLTVLLYLRDQPGLLTPGLEFQMVLAIQCLQ